MKVNVSKAIPPQQFDKALSEVLMDWYDNEEKKFNKAIDEAIDAGGDVIKRDAPVYTGEYRRSFAINKGEYIKHHYKGQWYVRNPEYRLTHWLENGHPIKDGTGRIHAISPPIKHIKYGRQIAEKVLKEKIEGLWGG